MLVPSAWVVARLGLHSGRLGVAGAGLASSRAPVGGSKWLLRCKRAAHTGSSGAGAPAPAPARGQPLQGRVAIVTGSTEGIGLAVARRLIEDGARVVVSSRKEANVERALGELRAEHGADRVAGLVCHVGEEAHRKRLVDFALGEFGAIHILVSNVAVNPYFGSFMDMKESHWDKIFDVNVKAPFMLTQKVVPHMLKNAGPGEKGAIVYVSSIAAYSGMAAIGAYSISKTALLGLSKNMSMELAQEGVRVNLVAPGVIKTKFSNLLWANEDDNDFFKASTHLKRLGEAHELGGVVSFLCGPDASYLTGENIVVAGGYHCNL